MQYLLRPLERTILAQLSANKLHGYTLLGLSSHHSTVYYTLHKLARLGLVERTTISSFQGPPRKVYSITTQGRQALNGPVTEQVMQQIRQLQHSYLRKLRLLTQLLEGTNR